MSHCQVIETTILVSFDFTFIGRDQKQRRSGKAFRASLTCFWLSLINFLLKDTWSSIYHVLLADLVSKRQRNQRKPDAVFFGTC